ncbi:MAG: TolC family protein [Oceanospirillales bacterium]|nr:TolC family protein [Oceanospirillales bacterium]MBR9888307.1 TolC family protein [Oceanospirillales bacterium]
MWKPALTTILLGTVALSGCAITPQELTISELQSTNQMDREQLLKQMTPVSGTLTLNEAIARALKYNLDQRVKNLEESLKAGELEAGKYDMLPKLMAKAGYNWRDNFSHRWEGDYIDGSTTPAADKSGDYPAISVDPRHGTTSLALSWNLLDFGASYYSAKQNADKLLIANEKRRRAMHTLIQNVRAAYWKALSAETLAERVRTTIQEAEKALQESQELADERVSSPDQALRYQRNLLENLRLLESVERDLASARIQLSSLIGALPVTRYTLVEPKTDLTPLSVSLEQMEERALLSNADLREQFFNTRIAAQDTRKALLKLLPGISFDYGYYHDDDRFLVNNEWSAAGVSVSYNLFNLLSASSRMNAAEKNEALAAARRMALQMAVVTQVHLSAHNYTDALRQFNRADQIFKVDRQLEEIVRGKFKSNMASNQVRIATNVTTILSELRRYQAMAKFQEASGKLQASMGMEPVIGSVDDIALADLTGQVNDWIKSGIRAETVKLAE